MTPGSDLDHRGTPFTPRLLDGLLTAVRDLSTGRPRLGHVLLDEAEFSGDARFDDAHVTRVASFGGARFGGGVSCVGTRFEGDLRFGEAKVAHDAWFDGAEILGAAWFHTAEIAGALHFAVESIGGNAVFQNLVVGGDATFSGTEFLGIALFTGARIGGAAWFNGAAFRQDARFTKASLAHTAWFDGAWFDRDARFDSTTMGGDASFHGAYFRHGAGFSGATITGDAGFDGAEIHGTLAFRKAAFEKTAMLGPLAFAGTLDLSGAVFRSAVTIEAAAREIHCRRTRWSTTATLRLSHAEVDLTDAVLDFPVSVTGRPRPVVPDDGEESTGQEPADPGVRLTSLRGVDAAQLALNEIDLTHCHFIGAIHLDQLRLEGRCPLPPSPERWRWSRRRTLIEEHHWRATRYAASGWTPGPAGADVPLPTVLAPVYRQLRKALEDGRNVPGAADFYYGEMEMRRHDPESSRGERALLRLYWATSGYGLRATRALGWLLLAVTATVLAIMLWGLPQDDPKARSTGKVSGDSITLVTDTPDPTGPRGPYRGRVTAKRFEKSVRVVVNSVVFRSSGQQLSPVGTYVEMASRIVEPALLGLAALAVRSRVRR
ncbi:pentapeptide repeat-containing protein [Streptomyces laurentii]|uniref:pentapeptide repeat-containing protein n=1 Tax=Streptomyces laurentii TaxID=39478 RepID=UPI003694BE4B